MAFIYTIREWRRGHWKERTSLKKHDEERATERVGEEKHSIFTAVVWDTWHGMGTVWDGFFMIDCCCVPLLALQSEV
jgi:hypothetical protein